MRFQSQSDVRASANDDLRFCWHGTGAMKPAQPQFSSHQKPTSNDGSWLPTPGTISGPAHQNISVISAPPNRSACEGTISTLDSGKPGELDAREMLRYDMPL